MKVRTWFQRLLISYLPVFLVISISLLSITFLIISEISKKAALQSNEVLAVNMMQQLDSILRNVESTLIKEATQNNAIIEYFDWSKEPDEFNRYKASLALSQFVSNQTFIESAYLYRPRDQIIVTPTALFKLQEFTDAAFIMQQVRNLEPYEWEGPRIFAECPDSCAKRNVVTLVRAIYDGSKGLIVINIPTAALRSTLEQMGDLNTDRVKFLDRDGRLLFTPADSAHDPAVRNKSIALDSISSLKSDYTGWVIETSIYSNKLFGLVSSLFYVWISLAVLVIVLGIAWIIYVSRKNYKPVQTILRQIDHDQLMDFGSGLDAPITDDFIRIKKTLGSLQGENKENKVYRSRFMFQNLLYGNLSPAHKEVEAELERFQSSPGRNGFIVSVIEFDEQAHLANDYGQQEKDWLKLVLKDSLDALLHNRSTPAWIDWIDPHRLGILLAKDVQETLGIAERLQVQARETLKLTISIGVGVHVMSAEEIAHSFQKACHALEFKASLGNNSIISYGEVCVQPQNEMFRQLNRIRSIAQFYRLGDVKWRLEYEAFYKELNGQLFSREDLYNMFHYLIYHLQKEISQLNDPLLELWNKRMLPSLQEALRREDTFEELYYIFHGLLTEYAKQMEAIRQMDTRYHLIEKVKAFIEREYEDPDLSLSKASDAFQLSTSYLSRTFKEESGQNFVDYVTKVRVLRAKLLLETTNSSIQHIGLQVGYINPLTFIRVFKKEIGVTPGYYQKTNKISL
ncbi:helix-turn-helix domain-containing protein [Paenibacillus koleovorans]|uniref:helix-turn-helix domain-containing protein n=1 Tax=Paenibacillus koleovorans TaxID=121608 RepID=UPI0013E31CD3|nr:helix-turn-helix domain-containing protein [Paenibacillus koleovorans]